MFDDLIVQYLINHLSLLITVFFFILQDTTLQFGKAKLGYLELHYINY